MLCGKGQAGNECITWSRDHDASHTNYTRSYSSNSNIRNWTLTRLSWFLRFRTLGGILGLNPYALGSDILSLILGIRQLPWRWSSPIRQWLWWELGIATSKQAGSCTKQVVMIGNRLWVSMYRHNLISNLISNLYLILSCLVSRQVTLLQRWRSQGLPGTMYTKDKQNAWLSDLSTDFDDDLFYSSWTLH